jgi:cobalt-zinc-cadmium efflux system membrane fusion protein
VNPFRYARASLTVAAPVILLAACSTDAADKAAAAATTPRTFTLTAEQRAKITVDTVRLTDFRPVLDVTGTVAFNGDRSTQVLSSISGPVARLVAPLGAQVSPGDLLATASSPDFASAVADLRKAEAANANAIRTTARAQALFRNDALARSDLDQSVTDSTSAAADLDAAIQALRALGVGDATIASVRAGAAAAPIEAAIRAPIAGTVVERLVNPGQVLEAGATPTFTIADLASMWVNASVYGADVALVRAGEAVDVIVDGAAKPVSGRVDYVAPIVDPATKATAVRIVAENPGQLLKRDLFVQLRIHAATERRGLLVSSTAVLRDDENLPFVFIAAADGTFLRRRVTLGRHADLRYEILDGLAAGDKVVSNGALFIQFAESQ